MLLAGGGRVRGGSIAPPQQFPFLVLFVEALFCGLGLVGEGWGWAQVAASYGPGYMTGPRRPTVAHLRLMLKGGRASRLV